MSPTANAAFTVMYGYFIGYLVAPDAFASANIIDLVAGMPDIVKYAGKTILAAPFAYHSWNGLRHLSWDMTKCKCIRKVLRTMRLILHGK